MEKFHRKAVYGFTILLFLLACGITSCKKNDVPSYTPSNTPLLHTHGPTITNFSPKSCIGGNTCTITITGTNFSENTADNTVTIGSHNQAKILKATSTTLVVEAFFKEYDRHAPINVTVKQADGDLFPGHSSTDFIVAPNNKPYIYSIQNRLITDTEEATAVITGANFSNIPNENKVTIEGIKARIIKASETALTVKFTLPAGTPLGWLRGSTQQGCTVQVGPDATNSTNMNHGNIDFYVINKAEVDQIRDFFNQKIGSLSNGELLKKTTPNFDPHNPNTWEQDRAISIKFNHSSSGRLNQFYIIDLKAQLNGELILKNCIDLEAVNVKNQNLTEINLTGASPKLQLNAIGNRLGSIILSNRLKGVVYGYSAAAESINPQQAGYGPATVDVK